MSFQHHIGGEIKMVSNLIQRNINCDLEWSEVTRAQGWVIGFIRRRDEQGIATFQKDIEKAYEIRRSTATGILQLLEKNEYLRKESVAEDGRLKKLVLTPKAIQVHEKIITKLDRFERKLIEGVSEEELEIFLQVIEKMKYNLSELEAKKVCSNYDVENKKNKIQKG